MRKFAPLTLLLGMLSALLFGGAGVAQATSVSYDCYNISSGVACDALDDVTGKKIGDITINDVLTLSNEDLSLLEIELKVKIGDLRVKDIVFIKGTVVVIFEGSFDIKIAVTNVTVCILAKGCG